MTDPIHFIHLTKDTVLIKVLRKRLLSCGAELESWIVIGYIYSKLNILYKYIQQYFFQRTGQDMMYLCQQR